LADALTRHDLVLARHMIRRVFAEAHLWVAERCLAAGDHASARAHLAKSLWHRPAQGRTAALLILACLPVAACEATRRAYRRARGRGNDLRPVHPYVAR
jgi:hypothetical protein